MKEEAVMPAPKISEDGDYVKGMEIAAEKKEQERLDKEEKDEKNRPLYLRKKGTDEIFAYNPYLAARDDMYGWPWPTLVPPTPKETNDIEKEKRISDIVSTIGKLTAADFNPQGQPKVYAISNVLGYKISILERDEAFEAYKKGVIDGNSGRDTSSGTPKA